jgi:hypothetical protein
VAAEVVAEVGQQTAQIKLVAELAVVVVLKTVCIFKPRV